MSEIPKLLTGEKVEVPGYKARHVFGVVLGVPLVLGSVLILLSPASIEDSVVETVLIGLAGLLLFGFGLSTSVWRLLRKGPMVVLDEHGITDFMWRKPRFMAWTELKRVEASRLRTLLTRISLVALIPNDPTRFLAERPELRRKLTAHSKEPYKMVITEANMDPYKLRDLILQFQNRYGSPDAPPVAAEYPRY